jgi:PKD repeat protein
MDVTHQYDSPGTYTVVMTVTDSDGAETEYETTIDVIQPLTIVPDPDAGRRRNYYTVGILALVIGGAWFWGRSQPKPEPKKEEEKEEEPKPKDFCEEHPEVVEQEENACWDAQMDLDSAVGDVQDQYDEAVPRWQSNAANVTKLITEWDATVQMINYWTGVEDEIEEDAETVQEVAGFVTNAAGKAKTAFKEGGEAAMRELGEDVAKDVGKSVLGDISSTIGQVLELEGWAIKEIGLGIAKGLTGVDPEANAVRLRQQSEQTFAGLCSWVRHSEAWNQGRRPPDTLQSLLEDIQGMQNTLDQAKQAFEDAVKDFRCVMCDIPEHISEEIDALEKNLEKWEKTFEKLKEEVEKRIEEAKELYKNKELYESPYEYLDKAQDNIDRANKALNQP